MKRLLFCIFLIATGMFSGAVVHAANNCTGATYYDADSDTCIACPAGYDYNTDSGKTDISQCQTHCAAGTYVDGYTMLEYIESTGTQYIDTGIVVGNSNLDVSFDAAYAGPTSGSQYGFITAGSLGARGAGISFGVRNDQWSVILPGSGYNTFGSATQNKVHFDWEIANNKSIVGGYDSNSVTSDLHFGLNKPWRNENVYLFATPDVTNAILAKLYQVTVKLDDVIVSDMIPVRRNSDNAVGMYDRVTKKFFANVGTGTFVAGPDIGVLWGQCENAGFRHWAAESVVNYGSVGTRTACPAGTHSTTETGASADVCVACSSNEFEFYSGDVPMCIETKFSVTTTEMNAGDTFSFYMSAKGTFYIDWGDGTVEPITRVSNTEVLYSHTYTNASGANGWSIKFGGVSATVAPYFNGTISVMRFFGGTPAMVAEISGSLGALFPTRGNGNSEQPRFINTFKNCTNLTGPIPNNMFSGISGAPVTSMFESTFNGCTNLTGAVPSGIFAGITGAPASKMFMQTFNNTKITSVGNNFLGQITSGGNATQMFYQTFANCKQLTSVPVDMFNFDDVTTGTYMFSGTFSNCNQLTTLPVIGGFDGVPQTSMFDSTFSGCTNLTGPIPNNMFSGISGSPAPYMFYTTFYGCSNLTGAVPSGIFAGIRGAPASKMFMRTFYSTKITSVGNNFLGQITSGGDAIQMFYQTFANCKQLTSVPVDMFNFDDVTTGAHMFAGTFSGDSALTALPVIGDFDGAPQLSMFESTFNNCTNLTGPIPNNMFSGISGSPATNMFYTTFSGCSNLTGAVPSGIFAGITGAPASKMFMQTFYNTKITSVGNNFLGQITSGGDATQMFYQTFTNCKQLTSVPVDMFNFDDVTTGPNMFAGTFSGDSALTTLPVIGGFDGAPQASMFHQTFNNCTNLTGPIPNNMFSGITGTPAQNMFNATFANCKNLTGYVPSTLFSGISTGTTATYQMYNVFWNTALYTSCPCGTRPYNTGFESYFNMRGNGANTVYATACEIGTKSNEHWHNGICTTDCALGFTQLHIGDNIAYPIVAEKVSNPAINIGTGNNVCYVPLMAGTATNAINMSDGVNSYHAVVPDETAPVGFTGQPG